MKRKSSLWLIMGLMTVILTLPRTASPQDERRYERREQWRRGDSRDDWRRLEGTWYLNGEHDKPCKIVSTHDGLEARNERGEASPLVYDRYGSVRARDWEGGLRGQLQRDRIEWANGTTWTRVASRH
jgi:hypothetical protein